MGNKKAKIGRQEAENKGSQAEAQARLPVAQWTHKQTKAPDRGGSRRGQSPEVHCSERGKDLVTSTSEQVLLIECSKSRSLRQDASDLHY